MICVMLFIELKKRHLTVDGYLNCTNVYTVLQVLVRVSQLQVGCRYMRLTS